MAIGAAIGAVTMAVGEASKPNATALDVVAAAFIGLIAGGLSAYSGGTLGPGLAATLGTGEAMTVGMVGGAVWGSSSYSLSGLYAESQGRGGDYSLGGMLGETGKGALFGALMGAAFQVLFGKAPPPTAKPKTGSNIAFDSYPDGPVPGPRQVTRIGPAPEPPPLEKADSWGKAICVGQGPCGGAGTPQAMPPRPPSEPTLLRNGDQIGADIDAAFASGRENSGTMVQFSDKGGALSGSGPKQGTAGIWYHDNVKIPGAGPGGATVQLRTHSPNPAATGAFSQSNYTTQINTAKGLYRLPDGTWKTLGSMTPAERAAAHMPAGN